MRRRSLVDREALEAAQEANDVMLAHPDLQGGLHDRRLARSWPRPALRGGGAIDPIAVYRASGYRAHKARERPAVAGSSSGIV